MSKGYVVKEKGSAHKTKHPLFCPHCKKISGTLDDRFFEVYGVCAECHVNHIDCRSTSFGIDLEKYIPESSTLHGKSCEELLSLKLTDPKVDEFLAKK